MLLTRSRLCPGPKPGSSLHLHVLGTPPAFVLSQDQTLREELHKELSGIPLVRIGATNLAATPDERNLGLSLVGETLAPTPSRRTAIGSPKYTEELRETRRVNLGTVARSAHE